MELRDVDYTPQNKYNNDSCWKMSIVARRLKQIQEQMHTNDDNR